MSIASEEVPDYDLPFEFNHNRGSIKTEDKVRLFRAKMPQPLIQRYSIKSSMTDIPTTDIDTDLPFEFNHKKGSVKSENDVKLFKTKVKKSSSNTSSKNNAQIQNTKPLNVEMQTDQTKQLGNNYETNSYYNTIPFKQSSKTSKGTSLSPSKISKWVFF